MTGLMNIIIRYLKNNLYLLLPISLFLYGGRNIFLPQVLQQDDMKELDIENYGIFSCVWYEGDNHPLWSSIIWVVSRTSMPTQTIILSLNIVLALFSLVLTYYFLEKKYSKVYAILGSSILGNSFIFTYYSSNLKQYQIEILYSILALIMYERFNNEKKDYYTLIPLAIFFALLSNVTIFISLLFLLALAIDSIKDKKDLLLSFLLLAIPAFIVVNNKVSRISFKTYWEDFFINIDSFQEFTNSIYFLSALFIRGLFGGTLWQIGLLIFSFAFIYSLIKKQATFSIVVILSLILCSIFKLYPLGAGRTDIIFYPFVLHLVINFLNEIRTGKIGNNLKVLPLLMLVVASTFIDIEPVYKKENINKAVSQVFKQDKDSVVLVTDEQYLGFIHYSKEIFGETIDNSNECSKKLVKNNKIYNLKDGYDENIFEKIDLSSNRKIWVVGIELDGTKGRFRLAENYLVKNSYKKIAEHKFDIGIYTIEYRKINN